MCYEVHAHKKNLNIIKNNVHYALDNETNKKKNRPTYCVTNNEIKKGFELFLYFQRGHMFIMLSFDLNISCADI